MLQSRYWKRFALLNIVATLMIVALSACGGDGTADVKPTPTTSDPSELIQYDLGIPDDALKTPSTGEVPGDTLLHILISFKLNDDVINQLGNEQGENGQGTDLASKANEIGITDEQFQQLKTYFGVENVSYTLSKLHTSVNIDMKASSFTEKTNVKLVNHEYKGRKFFAPDKTISLPRFIVEHIEGIQGLDNYSQAPQDHLQTQTLAQSEDTECLNKTNVNPKYVTYDTLRTAYGFDKLYAQGWTGKGLTVILPEFATYNHSDLSYYFGCVGYHGNLKTINVGPAPTEVSGEETLDIEMIAGLASDANIEVYQSQLDDNETNNSFWQKFYLLLEQIANDNSANRYPKMISISWGSAEATLTKSTTQSFTSILKLLTKAEHITTFVASGDCGAYDNYVYGDLMVDFFASQPSVVAVGGTALAFNAQGGRDQEVVWSDGSDTTKCHNQWGSGGGLSEAFARPSWQSSQIKGMDNEYSTGKRQVPDVAAVADYLPMYLDGKWTGTGGTSASAPIWAAAFAVINQGLIEKTHYYMYGPDSLYLAFTKADSFHPYYDVVEGDNLYYKATEGWDYTTGLGTPNLDQLYQVYFTLIRAQTGG